MAGVKIEIGKYVITSDSLCFILNKKKKVKEGENKGDEYLSNVGYYSTMENCMEGLLQYRIRKSQATSIKELLEEISRVSELIRSEFGKARAGK